MMVWDTLNSVARLLLAMVLVYKLVRFWPLFNAAERWGMSLAASGSLMTITVIWDGMRSPYDGWSTTVFTCGVLLYFGIGRMSRHWRHERANSVQVEHAQHYFRERRK